MHAGAGIIHSERPSQPLAEQNGTQEVIQLWINSPAKRKMVQPDYQYLAKAEIPTFLSDDQKFHNRLIAGEYGALQGKIATQSDLLIIWSTTTTQAAQILTVPDGYNCMLYVVQGEITITEFGKVVEKSLVIFENNNPAIGISANSKAQFLLLSGMPIDEKIVQHGPFVMNTTTEILEAMRDYQMGKMGVLIEEN
jgi:redox-sensitive bicupin YhaK (pirin superfamily)